MGGQRRAPAVVVGLIETLRFEQGLALFVREHEARLRASWSGLFDAPAPSLARTVAAAIARAATKDGLARVAFTRAVDGTPAREVELRALPSLPKTVSLAIARAPRGESPAARRLKSADRRWVDRLADENAFETLVWDDDHGLLEGTRTNLFVVGDGELVTPPVSSGLVPGVVRAAVLAALSPPDGSGEQIPAWRIHERPVAPGDLKAARGLLLTGVGVGVAAVAECDGRPVSLTVSAPLARRLWRAVTAANGSRAQGDWTKRRSR